MICAQYDGTFELDFLADDEAVRATGDGTGDIEIINRYSEMIKIRLHVGDWVERIDGKLSIRNDEWPDFLEK